MVLILMGMVVGLDWKTMEFSISRWGPKSTSDMSVGMRSFYFLRGITLGYENHT